jgi:lysozyme family protein
MDFDLALAFVLDQEGGYSKRPDDPETNYGITIQTARAYGYRGPIGNIPLDIVRRIYRQGYWERCRCDDLPEHPLRLVVFDAAVNSGPGQSIKWLQQAVGVEPDGVIGAETLRALSVYNGRTLQDLTLALIERRLAFLRGLSKWRTFGRGWSRRIAALREVVTT